MIWIDRDIEFPQDGEEVIACCNDNVVICVYGENGCLDYFKKVSDNELFYATHWMPKPTPFRDGPSEALASVKQLETKTKTKTKTNSNQINKVVRLKSILEADREKAFVEYKELHNELEEAYLAMKRSELISLFLFGLLALDFFVRAFLYLT